MIRSEFLSDVMSAPRCFAAVAPNFVARDCATESASVCVRLASIILVINIY